MAEKLKITFDSDLIESVSSDFDLRSPNKEALRRLIFTLDGDYDPAVMQVLNLATGVGKTYLMAAFVEYLRRQGVKNVVIVTPGKVVQAKTIQNFTPGSPRYIEGAQVPPDIVTPKDYSAWVTRVNGEPRLSFGNEVPMLAFIFNIQQLIAPKEIEGSTRGSTQDAERRKPRRFDENAGVLFDYLKDLKDLVVIADESHLYSTSAAAFNAALKELDPAASVGLTASVLPGDHVIYKYPLYQAIQDKYVKAPVLAFRRGGYSEDKASEEQQLRDALRLREIKQAYYDAYSAQNEKPHLNAVMFVVCSDVEHATQITELLRTPEFLNSEMAVLQVDSEHDDEATQNLLERLDEPDSPVIAVVSVNKLKEGWDVKNIAVVVTLRAMASEVLTQQTMGRGLRLPFGKYTDVKQIDQLDIIAHQSFQELLEAENVLVQFGLEEAVPETNGARIKETVRRITQPESRIADSSSFPEKITDENYATSDQVETFDIYPGERGSGAGTNNHDEEPPQTVRFRPIDDDQEEVPQTIEPITITRNPRFEDVEYYFPVTTIQIEQPPIDMSGIDEGTIEAAARRVTSTGDILYRKEIVAALGERLRAVDTESAEIDSIHIEKDDAKAALVRLVVNMQLVPKNNSTARIVENYLVPRFMSEVGFDEWTVKALSSARIQLQDMISEYISGVLRNTREIPSLHPKKMNLNGYMLPLGERTYEPIERQNQFVRGRVYSGWFKSLFENESFDSYTGEYELARLLNLSPNIKWWHRLHPQDGAYIYYNSRDRYFPDFVALDNEGVHWIIEGKDMRGRDDAKVQAKRTAAESLVRRLSAEEEYEGEYWGYMIAYEDDIERAESWNDLKTFAQPVSNKI